MNFFSYLCSMNVVEYLKKCSVKSVDELTDEQVVNYYKGPDIYIGQKCAVLSAIRDCDYKGVSKNLIMTSVRKALKTGQDFKLYYVDNESANGPIDNKTGWVVEP